METTTDKFLNGRVIIEQPKFGYRAATDPVLLAASVDISLGSSVLDVGCGVGVAGLCLASRSRGVELSGLEVQPEYAALASSNAEKNKIQFSVHTGDLNRPPIELRNKVFDQVITNPPFHQNKTKSNDMSKALADHETLSLHDWISHSLRRLRPQGYFTIIHMAEVLPQIFQALGNCGDLRILPIAPRQDQNANRVIVRARKISKTPACILPPLIMHTGQKHTADQDSYAPNVKNILRDGGVLHL